MDGEEIVDVTRMPYEARAALVLYGLTNGDAKVNEHYAHSHSFSHNFVTVHAIRSGVLCEGRPITKKKLLELCKVAMPSLSVDMAYIPENVISYMPVTHTMFWWAPAAVRHLFFDESTHIPSGKAPCPPLLFRFSSNNLAVFALKENKRPGPDTPIFSSPFWNFQCMGDVELPETPSPSDTGAIEELFFRSAFSYHNPPKLKGTTGDALWKSLVKSGKTEFPYEHLVKVGTVSSLLKGGEDD